MDSSRYSGPLAGFIRRQLRPEPDPWSADVAARVNDKAATPLCLNCLFPQGPHAWFCLNCGFPTGEYVVLMPYLQNFVLGEALRRGVMGAPERRCGVQAFFVLYSICEYTVFAPLYWYWMLRRSRGRPIATEQRPELVLDDNE